MKNGKSNPKNGSNIEGDSVNVHKGHRERTRDTYLSGNVPIPDHMLLEILLYYSIPQVNTNVQAHRLIDNFGGLRRALDAPVDRLVGVEGIGVKSAQLIHLVSLISHRYAELVALESLSKNETINSVQDLARIFIPKFMGLDIERVCLMVLDEKNKIIFCDFISEGNLDSADLEPDTVVKKATASCGKRIAIAHNHPSGNTEPTAADISATRNLKHACDLFSIEVLDHLVISGYEYSSVFETIAKLNNSETEQERFFARHPELTHFFKNNSDQSTKKNKQSSKKNEQSTKKKK